MGAERCGCLGLHSPSVAVAAISARRVDAMILLRSIAFPLPPRYPTPTHDFSAVPQRYRALVPEYVEDYVALNQFAA